MAGSIRPAVAKAAIALATCLNRSDWGRRGATQSWRDVQAGVAETMEHGRNGPYSLMTKSNRAMMNTISQGPISLGCKDGG
ncbi:hypothetical protein, partial [Stenotrophomonas maltophilia]|uniref:hypothetical protein n=1 Tax=Stenotrophomonas maltophilia TaxID=40324 RepID=UPI001E2E7201